MKMILATLMLFTTFFANATEIVSIFETETKVKINAHSTIQSTGVIGNIVINGKDFKINFLEGGRLPTLNTVFVLQKLPEEQRTAKIVGFLSKEGFIILDMSPSEKAMDHLIEL